MDGIDYTKQLNRKNELFRRDIKKANSAHADNLNTVKEAAAHKAKSQSDAYNTDRTNSEKNFNNTISKMRSNQAETLRTKNKDYLDSVEKQKENFHNTTKNNMKEWNKKVSDLRDTFDRDISFQKKRVSENDKALKDSFAKDKSEILKRHQNQKLDLVMKDFEKKNRMRDHVTNELDKIKDNTEKNYIAGRDLAASNFEEMSSKVNAKQADFNQNELKRVKDAAAEGIAAKNRAFGKKYTELRETYNSDVRNTQREAESRRVTDGEFRKNYDEKLRGNEKAQFDQRKEILLKNNEKNTNFYNSKMDNLKEAQQDELRKETIRNADKLTKEKESNTIALQEKDYKNKINQERLDHTRSVQLAVERSENELQKTRTENNKDTAFNNLKSDFKQGMERARIATQESMEDLKQESIIEKRDIQNRLRNQNSETTTQLKNFHNTKYEIMKNDLEAKILNLKNQNEAVQRNAITMVNDIRSQSATDLEQQVISSEQKLKVLLNAERETSHAKETSLKKTIAEAQAGFAKKMNELSHSNRIKMKTLSSTLVAEAKKDVAAQQEENQIQKRYFTREIERLKSSSDAEREALVTQYEDRMKEMKEIYANKVAEIKSFNKLENA